MRFFELVFKAISENPFVKITSQYSSLKVFVWCNRFYEVIEIIGDDQESKQAAVNIIDQIEPEFEFKATEPGRLHYIGRCFCDEKTITKIMDKYNILHVMPIVYYQGGEYYHIILFHHQELDEFFQQVEKNGYEIEIVQKVPFDGYIASSFTLRAESLFARLTEKQLNALLTAYKSGYYDYPRKINVTTLTAKKQLTRTTFLEHLRKAESKIINSLAPYLELYTQSS